MKKSIFALCILAVASQMGFAADLRSTFNTDADGWRGEGDFSSLGWVATGGNPGGYLRGMDAGTGIYWYFVTPQAWAGDWRGFRSLRFDQWASPSAPLGGDVPEVEIIGANGTTLAWEADHFPNVTWTRFSLALAPATFGVDRAVFLGVMANVTEMRIRGEFVTGLDEGGLDNVVLAEGDVDVDLKGTITGIGKHKVTCTNARTGESVSATIDKAPFNCDGLGLTIVAGDKITVTISGKAE